MVRQAGHLQGQSVSGLTKADSNRDGVRKGGEQEVNPEFKYGMLDVTFL